MPRVLWCNLDPQWPFARMLHDHCIDWLARDDIWIWDVHPPAPGPGSPWDDWPRVIAPDALLDALDELPAAPDDGRLVALHLPPGGVGPTPIRAVLDVLAERVAAAPAGWELFLSLAERDDVTPYRSARFGARLIARLSDNPCRRLRTQRLLIELGLDPVLAADQVRLPDPGVLDASWQTDPQQPDQDHPSVQWHAALPAVLGQIAALERPGAAPEQPLAAAFARPLAEIEALRAGTGIPAALVVRPGERTPAAAAAPPLSVRAPWSFDPSFPDRLRGSCNDFLKDLDAWLAVRWQALDTWRLAFNAGCKAEDQRLDHELRRLTPIDVGFSDQGRKALDTWGEQLADAHQAIAAEGEQLASEIGRDVRLPGQDEGAGYVRHRFDEDQAFDEAVGAAVRQSAHLVRRSRLVSGWLIVTLLATVPILAMRLPGWLSGGLGPAGLLPAGLAGYVAQPPLWLFDLGWTLLPGVLLWAAGLVVAGRRRGALSAQLHEVQRCAEALWQRHLRVLDHMALYVSHTAAMRRLMLLRVHLRRIDRGVCAGRQALAAIQTELERQGRDYAAMRVPAAALPMHLSHDLPQWLQAGGGVLPWLAAVAGDLPVGARQGVRIDDYRLSHPGVLDTAFLMAPSTLQLRPVPHP